MNSYGSCIHSLKKGEMRRTTFHPNITRSLLWKCTRHRAYICQSNICDPWGFFYVKGHFISSSVEGLHSRPFPPLISSELSNILHISLILYFCSWFRTKDAAQPRWLLRLMQCWFLLILWPKEVVNMFLVFFICAFVSELWPQTCGTTSIQGEKNDWNP